MKYIGGVGRLIRKKPFDFGTDPEYDTDPVKCNGIITTAG